MNNISKIKLYLRAYQISKVLIPFIKIPFSLRRKIVNIIPEGVYCYGLISMDESLTCEVLTCPFEKFLKKSNIFSKCSLYNYEVEDQCKSCKIKTWI